MHGPGPLTLSEANEISPKAHNKLVGPQKPKEVVDESILQVLIPLERIAAVGIIGALLHFSSSAALHCTCTCNSHFTSLLVSGRS